MKKPPAHWESLQATPYWSAFGHKLIPLKVICSVSTVKSGEKWNHVSVSRPDRLPSWEELAKVKEEFLGVEVEAYHVIPRRQDYVNVHKYCLHIWSPLDGKRRVANLQDLVNEECPS